MIRLAFVVAFPACLCATAAAGDATARADPAPRLVPAPSEIFGDPPPPKAAVAFDVVATDLDQDGDVDVLVNWHHLAPFELLENIGGRFRAFRPPSGAGLAEDLYADEADMTRRVREYGRDGLYLWHDVDRKGRWRFLWRNHALRHPGLSLLLETSLGFLAVGGLGQEEHTTPDPRTLTIELAAGQAERAFSFKTRRVAVRLSTRRVPVAEGAPVPPVFVGAALQAAGAGDVVLWKSDPHGVAWLDLEGTPHPELFVTRGGLAGKLVPPLAPKHDDYFLHRGADSPAYQSATDAIPADYGRGRRVEAVDIDNDGHLELWLANRGSTNRLLRRGVPNVAFEDAAPSLGLDAKGREAGTWLDFDGDGWQDLLVVEDRAVDLLRNVEGTGFERIAGSNVGLTLPAVAKRAGHFGATQLRPCDVDRDGDLDLWVLGHGAAGAHRLYRRDGDRFEDVTDAAGLRDAAGGEVVLVIDLDDDALPDLVQFGKMATLWHNRGPGRFDRSQVTLEPTIGEVAAGTVLDADGDGRRDVLLVGRTRRLLWNRSEHRNGALEVTLAGSPAPIGALVTATYSDGSRVAQRYGSESSTVYSQALQPLRFGIAEGREFEDVLVRWPGETDTRRYAVEQRTAVRLER